MRLDLQPVFQDGHCHLLTRCPGGGRLKHHPILQLLPWPFSNVNIQRGNENALAPQASFLPHLLAGQWRSSVTTTAEKWQPEQKLACHMGNDTYLGGSIRS